MNESFNPKPRRSPTYVEDAVSYLPGDRVCYQSFGGSVRWVIIDAHYDDVKNGRPGFDGRSDQGEDVWGYDDQIVRVVRVPRETS